MDIRAGRRTVQISRPDKVLFPDDGLTKADLADYYRAVAPRMLPHLRGRALMMERYPDGIGDRPLMQKNTPEYFPDWIRRAELPKEGGTVVHPVADDTATLVYLAGQACVTPHRWQSRVDRPEQPDRLVFDLDPPRDDFAPVRDAALALRALLDELRLRSAVMATGSRGLHVIVPLDRSADFDTARGFALDVASLLTARHPDTLTTAARKQARGNRLYLDVQRNGYAQTAVAPYAVRARPGAPVAAPVTWSEVAEPGMNARRWTVKSVLDRLDDDPWHDMSWRGHAVSAAARRLERLGARTNR
ncbi:non-homologous end-joining DNA ligase [Yinghuangia soli]|uniref:Non-homologous end-joining DNA ligase n=1 Tax=Yinghuangia soli TaxID=2908204 RepID=A0AA41U405_9ACTN|nr:non-homologous end-joining DNA ligase [Yinghuangia soli]MCF2530297.1 non-homologous end-joining DNA ligase [Yinghuangia soli]